MAELVDLDVTKSVSIVFFFIVVMGFATLPMWNKFFSPRADNPHQQTAAMVCSLSNALSGGLFLALAVIHLLPEAAEQFGKIHGEEENDKYRPAFAVAMASYTLLLTIQRVIFSGHGHSHGDHGHGHSHDHGAAGESLALLPNDRVSVDYRCGAAPSTTVASKLESDLPTGGENEAIEEIRHSTRRSDNLVRLALEHPAPTTKVVTSLVLALSFSMHGFAEGMSLGLQKEEKAALILFGAIALHKWAEALSVGVSFSKTGLPRSQALIYITSFGLSTPIGIAVGWASSALLPEAFTAYFLAFSTGTFLYIGASDVVVEEFGEGGKNFLKLFFYLIGLVLVYLVTAFMDHDHDEDGMDASMLSSSSS